MKNLTKAFIAFLSQIIFVYIVWSVMGVNESSVFGVIVISLIWLVLSAMYGYWGSQASKYESARLAGKTFQLLSGGAILFLLIGLLMTYGQY